MAGASDSLAPIIAEVSAANAARKCHSCGCFRGALAQLRGALPALPAEARRQLRPVLDEGETRLVPTEYDCLGCAVCWPANGLNFAAEAFPDTPIASDTACPTDIPDRVPGWPPFPGNFRVLDAGGDVAVCVLTSEHLIHVLVGSRPERVAIVGSVYTENLGLERIIGNVLANPNLTTLVVCGADSQQRIGHLPGQSLLSLAANGLDERGRIAGAQGRRPVIKNIPRDAVESFRREIAIVDRVGSENVSEILAAIAEVPPATPRRSSGNHGMTPQPITAEPAARLVLDPLGYFVVLPDRARGKILVEHYCNDGVLAHVIEGERAEHLFSTVLARGLVSRLDHAAYLGKELALAEHALKTGEPYVQDRAPEPSCTASRGCGADARSANGGTP